MSRLLCVHLRDQPKHRSSCSTVAEELAADTVIEGQGLHQHRRQVGFPHVLHAAGKILLTQVTGDAEGGPVRIDHGYRRSAAGRYPS